ncbi:MAG: hypothetical protein DLM67_04720 [Candidatus Nephthysia bennettiae]|nr:MAG: hypothetical protein DLM67_04720 [Candidatus Dormibacteraeota bacterium]
MPVAVHLLNATLAGIWLGCLVFTTLVVSPAFKRMHWSDAERVQVRSALGRQFMLVANPILLLLLGSLIAGVLADGSRLLLVELALLLLVILLAATHGLFFGRRLEALAVAEGGTEAELALRLARRRGLQRASAALSTVNLVLSAVLLLVAVSG